MDMPEGTPVSKWGMLFGLAHVAHMRYAGAMRRLVLPFFAAIFLLMLLPVGNAWSRDTYKVGIRAISPPFSFLAVQDGEQGVRGYSVDEWVLIGDLLDADIEFVLVDSLDDYQGMYSGGRNRHYGSLLKTSRSFLVCLYPARI